MELVDASNCNCQANSEDRSCICEEKEDFERCIQLLNDPLLQQVFVMLYSNYARNEMAAALDLDPKIIRINIREVRKILQSPISNLQNLLLNDQAHHLNTLSQRIGYAAVGVG